MGIFTKTTGFFKDRLGKTRNKISSSLSSVLSIGRNLDEALLDELEETLISDDIGVETTNKLISELREAYRNRQIAVTDDVVPFLKEHIKGYWPDRDRQLHVAYHMESIRYDVSDSKRIPAVRSSFWVFDPSKAYEEKEFLKINKQALSELPGRLAQVFILHEVIELSSQEICEFMDISTCNLYVMMHRARKRLRCYLQLYK